MSWKVPKCCSLSSVQTNMTWALKWATIHYHRSRGCKSVTCQSWRSKKISLYSLFFLVKKGSNGSEVKSFLDLQLWQVTVLHQVYKLSHRLSAAKIHIFLHPISCIYILLSIYRALLMFWSTFLVLRSSASWWSLYYGCILKKETTIQTV